MIYADYYTGEPTQGSPQFSGNTDMSEQYAVDARDLYNYNSMQRQQQSQLNIENFGAYMNPPVQQGMMYQGQGYTGPTNPYTVQVSQNGGPMQPLMQNYQQNMSLYQQVFQQRYGAPQQATYYQGAPYMNQWQLQTMRLGSGSNYNYFQQNFFNQSPYQMPWNQQMFQQQYQDQVIHVPGYRPNGNIGMLRSDAEEVCEKMQVQMMLDQQKELAKRENRVMGFFNNNYGGYMNYYGTPYVNLSYDTNIMYQYKQKVNEMVQEAIQRRTDFYKNLSRLCHNYLGDKITEDDIDRLYDGYTYTIPAAQVQQDYHQDWLASLVPCDNSWIYRNHFNEVSSVYQMICPPGKSMNEAFEDYGLYGFFDNLEQEFHRRRDASRLYDGNIYDAYLRKYALQQEEEDLQSGVMTREKLYKKYQTPEQYVEAIQSGELSREDFKRQLLEPELNKNGITFTDKGELHFNLPSQWSTQNNNAPPGNILTNEQEMDFEVQRQNFINSIIRNRHMT